jgi:hypothetical protein
MRFLLVAFLVLFPVQAFATCYGSEGLDAGPASAGRGPIPENAYFQDIKEIVVLYDRPYFRKEDNKRAVMQEETIFPLFEKALLRKYKDCLIDKNKEVRFVERIEDANAADEGTLLVLVTWNADEPDKPTSWILTTGIYRSPKAYKADFEKGALLAFRRVRGFSILASQSDEEILKVISRAASNTPFQVNY